MGYESRIIIVERTELWNNYITAETIAEFNLCAVNWNPEEVFPEEIDFNFCTSGEVTKEDKYGKTCRMANIDDVVKALEEMAAKYNYRRFAPVIGLLKGFEQQKWDSLKVVHYGY